jgi:hypothetical protein
VSHEDRIRLIETVRRKVRSECERFFLCQKKLTVLNFIDIIATVLLTRRNTMTLCMRVTKPIPFCVSDGEQVVGYVTVTPGHAYVVRRCPNPVYDAGGPDWLTIVDPEFALGDEGFGPEHIVGLSHAALTKGSGGLVHVFGYEDTFAPPEALREAAEAVCAQVLSMVCA